MFFKIKLYHSVFVIHLTWVNGLRAGSKQPWMCKLYDAWPGSRSIPPYYVNTIIFPYVTSSLFSPNQGERILINATYHWGIILVFPYISQVILSGPKNLQSLSEQQLVQVWVSCTLLGFLSPMSACTLYITSWWPVHPAPKMPNKKYVSHSSFKTNFNV